MSNNKHRQPANPASVENPPSSFSGIVFYGMMAVIGGLLGYAGYQYYYWDSNPTPVVAANPEPAATDATPAAPTPNAKPATAAIPANLQTLLGNWVRSDGGYTIVIKSIAGDGKIEAAYLNPNPINVAKAEAKISDGRAAVYVELRDVNYPGSTYDLRYDAASDQLVGEYFQAGQQQRFQVGFDRGK